MGKEKIGDNNWEVIEEITFNPQKVEAVFDGAIAAYVIRGFISPEQCAAATDRFLTHPEMREDPVVPPIAKLGRSLYEYNDLGEYFSQAGVSQRSVDDVFGGIVTPLGEMTARLHEYFKPSGIVVRPLQHERRNGFYGVLRQWWGNQSGMAALPHEDFIEPKVNYDDLETNDLISELSIVCCLGNGATGGATRIYKRRPTKEEFDDPKNRQGYGFTHEFVADDPYVDVRLQAGDVLVFSAQNIHSVESVPADGPPRITQQLFMGQLEETGDIIYWS